MARYLLAGLLLTLTINTAPAGEPNPHTRWASPDDAAFVHVRAADLLATPLGKTLAALISEEFDVREYPAIFGVPFDQIETMTAIVRPFKGKLGDAAVRPIAVVTLREGCSADDLFPRLPRMKSAGTPIEGLGQQISILGAPNVFAVGERTFLISTLKADELVAFKPAASGPFLAAFRAVEDRNHVVAAGAGFMGCGSVTAPRIFGAGARLGLVLGGRGTSSLLVGRVEGMNVLSRLTITGPSADSCSQEVVAVLGDVSKAARVVIDNAPKGGLAPLLTALSGSLGTVKVSKSGLGHQIAADLDLDKDHVRRFAEAAAKRAGAAPKPEATAKLK